MRKILGFGFQFDLRDDKTRVGARVHINLPGQALVANIEPCLVQNCAFAEFHQSFCF